MSNVLKRSKKLLSVGLTISTIVWSVGLFSFLGVPLVAQAATAGDLVKSPSSSAVYLVGTGGTTIHVFPHFNVYLSWGYPADFSTVKTMDLSGLTPGNPVAFRDGSLFRGTATGLSGKDKTAVFVVENGKIRDIVSETVYQTVYNDASWSRVTWVPDDLLSKFAYPAGDQWNATDKLPGGTLFKTSGDDTLYLSVNDGGTYKKRAFSSTTAATANRFDTSKVLTVSGTLGTSQAVGTQVTGADSALSTPAVAQLTGETTKPATGLSVSLASNTPAASTLVQGQGVADLSHFTITNSGSRDAKVTKLTFKRLGVSADTTLSAVYVYEGSNRLTDSATVSTGVITVNNSAGIVTIPAGGSKTISVRSNIAGSSSGQTVGIGMAAATGIVTDNTSDTVSGTFPVNGNLHSIANASLATAYFATATTPSGTPTVDPQESYTGWQNTLTIGTRKASLKMIRFREIGSIDYKDLANFKLYVDAIQAGTTQAALDSNGYVTFDLSASPIEVKTGGRVIKVVFDVLGGSTRNFQMSLRETGDVMIEDSEYGVNVLPTITDTTTAFSSRNSGTISVSTGNLTVTKKTDSPSGDVVDAGSGITLAKYELKALGEKIKLEKAKIRVVASDASIGTLRNGAVYVEGIQVGSTTNISTAAAGTEFSFGSSVVVEPGKPLTMEIRADIFDASADNDVSTGDTLQAVVLYSASYNNAQRVTSAGYFDAPSANQSANTLTVRQGALNLAKDQGYGNQTTVVPKTNYLLGKFSLSATTTEAINLTQFEIDWTGANGFDPSDDLTNVYLKYGSKTTSVKSAVTDTDNTWSISEPVASNGTMIIEVYGDIAAAAYTSAAGADTMIAGLIVTGTTASSGTTVQTNSNTVISGQTITATNAGTLTVSVASDTPLASVAVAGSTPDTGALRLKLTSANEDVYVTKLRFRNDANADDVTIASAALYAGTSTLAQVSTAQTFNGDGSTNPGYVEWTLSGADRIKVTKDSSTYVVLKPTYVSSGQDSSVSDKTPRWFLYDMDAEGSAALSPSSATPNLVNDAGIIIVSAGATSSTFATSTETTATTALTATATTLVTANGITFTGGDVIFIDESADGAWDAATEELMAVVVDGGANLTVERGIFGTTSNAHTTGKTIYRLDNASTTRGMFGNAITVMKTKPTLAVASDSPTGSTSGGTAKVVFKFNVSAASNASDVAENKVVLTSVDISNTKTSSTVKNLKLYPSEYDQNSTYATTCVGLSSTEWRCTLSTTGATNEVLEGQTKTFVARADVGFSAAGSVEFSVASLGSSNGAGSITAGDVVWTDGSNSKSWVDQSPSYVQPASAMTTTAASGTADSVAPTITAVLVTDATEGNTLAIGDSIRLTFSEMIDPTTIASDLVPGGAATAALTDGATGDISALDPSGAGNDKIRIKNIIDLSVGNDTFVTADGATLTAANTATLDSTGTLLTLTISTALTGDGEAGATQTVIASSGGTTVKDLNGTAMTAAGSDAATVTSDAI